MVIAARTARVWSLFDGADCRNHEGELPVEFAARLQPAVGVAGALADLPPLTDHLASGVASRGEFRKVVPYSTPPGTAYAGLMRHWPGFPAAETVDDHAVRRTPRDYETFRRMRPGDRYPEAFHIACERLEEELEKIAATALPPGEGTDEWKSLRETVCAAVPGRRVRGQMAKTAAGYAFLDGPGTSGQGLVFTHSLRRQSGPHDFSPGGRPTPVLSRRLPVSWKHGRLLPPDR